MDIPIVEVNLESCIDSGYTIKLEGKSEEMLPPLFKELAKLQSKS